MIFLTACLLGSAACALRSPGALAIVAVVMPALFALSVLISGSGSLWLLLAAIAGLNAGVMLPLGLMLLLGRRSQHLR